MKNLQTIRKVKALTQVELATILGVAQSTVATWESGAGYPMADKLELLADTLNCTIDALYGRETPQAREAAS